MQKKFKTTQTIKNILKKPGKCRAFYFAKKQSLEWSSIIPIPCINA